MQKSSISLFTCSMLLGSLLCNAAYAKDTSKTTNASDAEFDEILSRDITDLKVTSVAKRSQRLTDSAAAVYVITQEELRRAGIYSIPEALRLVPGMQVAKQSTDRWAISARGFNGSLDNKLLVLLDGRAIYTPVFSGVYWGDQSTSINDIERIEVIRGPGASLYGANAVNGVVNIITKSAEDTQGNMLSTAITAKANGVYEARHGGKTKGGDYYRTWGQYQDGINWFRGRGGFRMDGKLKDSDSYTFQGDAFSGQQDVKSTVAQPVAPFSRMIGSTDDAYGANILGRWNHHIAKDSDLMVQSYVDYYGRNELTAAQHVGTADIQAQHTLKLDERNNFAWGGGGRVYQENIQGSYVASVNDSFSTHEILNIFAQNEYAVVPETLYWTLGSKLEYNDFTGVEVQPSTRLAWHPTDNQTVWGAVSRAVRTPSSIEQDVNLVSSVTAGAPPTEVRVFGNPDQKSEELIAYELGHRIQPTTDLAFDTALFYNDFSKLQTISSGGAAYAGTNGNNILPYIATNLGSGHVYGAEFAASYDVTPRWQLKGSYTYLKMNLDVKGNAGSLESSEQLAPRNQFSVQSYYNVTDGIHWDNMFYYVDNITAPVGDYLRYDSRLAYLVQPGLETSIIGRNLFGSHEEFPSQPQSKVQRSFIGQVLWKF